MPIYIGQSSINLCRVLFGFPYFEFRINIYIIYIVSVVSEPKYKREKKRECEIERNTAAAVFKKT